MTIRSLSGALILLIFTAPLNASLCGGCAPDHCMQPGMAGMAGSSGPSEPEAVGHCQKVEELSDETAACHGVSSLTAPSPCGTLAAALESETSAKPAVSTSFDFVLEVAVSIDAPVAGLRQAEGRQPTPPCLAPQPLYTLHSTFLI